MHIGILGLQGDFQLHEDMINKIGCKSLVVKKRDDLKKVDGLIIPGGESTTVGKLLVRYEIDKGILEERERRKFPIFGTCMGVVILAKKVFLDEQTPSSQFTLGIADVEVVRNAYGRQKESFEVDIPIENLEGGDFHAIFIRAPQIRKIGKEFSVMAKLGDDVIFAEGKNILLCTFHPELTDDVRVHRYFVNMVSKS